MFSRRRFLAGSALAALAPQLGFSSALAGPFGSIEVRGGRGRAVAALVVDLSVRPDRGDAATAACPGGSGALARCLRTGRLATFEIEAGGGSLGSERALEDLRRQVGEDRPLGLISWGDPGGVAAMAALGDAVDAIVLLDQVDGLAPDGPRGRNVLCHLALRRSPADGRAIARKLSAFERAGTPLISHWYDADPGFATPDSAQRGRNADLVWRRSAAFLKGRLDRSEAGAQLARSAAGRAPTIG